MSKANGSEALVAEQLSKDRAGVIGKKVCPF